MALIEAYGAIPPVQARDNNIKSSCQIRIRRRKQVGVMLRTDENGLTDNNG